MNQYEFMFLFEPTFATDFSKVRAEVERIVGRADGEIVRIAKWDERKLAYEIKGCKRGCYVLSYVNCDGDKITGIERDVHLSEPILRVLIKRADGLSVEHMERFLPTERPTTDDTAPTTTDDGATETETGDSVAEGVVLVPHGWSGEANANLLTDVQCRECILGYPDMKSLMCSVRTVDA